jgi:hypothetical protein
MPVIDSWITFAVNPVKVTISTYIIKTHNVTPFFAADFPFTNAQKKPDSYATELI